MIRKITKIIVDIHNQIKSQTNVKYAVVAILALQISGCTTLRNTAEVESAENIEMSKQIETSQNWPVCDPSSIETLNITGGRCQGILCPKEYFLHSDLEMADKVHVVHVLSRLSVKGSTWKNRNLRASAKSYQRQVNARYRHSSDLTIEEPVNGPIDGSYLVKYILRDEKISGIHECVIQRENTFSERFEIREDNRKTQE